MDLSNVFHDAALGRSTRPQVPVRILRDLLVRPEVGLGSKVLVVGSEQASLVPFLNELSCHAVGIDDVSRSAAFSEVFASLGPREFDLVLMGDDDRCRHDLLSLEARVATAKLLALLKPRGLLTIVRHEPGRRTAAAEAGTAHASDCQLKHLACFPCSIAVAQYPPHSWWNWFRSRTRSESYTTLTAQVPGTLMTPAEWQMLAAEALATGVAPCCRQAWEMAQSGPTKNWRAA